MPAARRGRLTVWTAGSGRHRTGSGPAALHAVRLGYRHRGGRWVLWGCDLVVPAGEIVVLAGASGAGKSTLLRLAAGLSRPTTGWLTVVGAAPGSARARRGCAFVGQDAPLYPHFTVADTLRLGRELNRGWDDRAAHAVVRSAGIGPGDRVGALPPAARTRVALALALGKRPELLLLDEPLTGLDPAARRDLLAPVLADHARRGTTVLLSVRELSDVTEPAAAVGRAA
ncbi:putative ABC transporter ATP-binding protein [Streptantibioticus cattleyicolor NRRL 8057 = DSM 46488]|uniref:Putative ABC transporter ATP-binding protein n=1 Tax=Streptantibioticus cattleyicolor (strain ATCC 35852 / DSM 46488 / JCM 4925 / NBRC 14057 / NRRL 8057) TaxID=1003195 RepID=G8WZP8_STREN|nr:putative ABC transporter ATP-binding protein [Streptantibioticus cattleyicolor NRRL 8057 = DSM 46488]